MRSSITASLLSSQLFLAIAAVTSLVLAALTSERTRALWQLVQSEGAQRSLAEQQGALRRIATLVAAEARPDRGLRAGHA